MSAEPETVDRVQARVLTASGVSRLGWAEPGDSVEWDELSVADLLGGVGPFRVALQYAVLNGDSGWLRRLCFEDTALHALLVKGARSEPRMRLGYPYREREPYAGNAVRAVAALGLALTASEAHDNLPRLSGDPEGPVGWIELALRYLEHRGLPGAGSIDGPLSLPDVANAHQDRLNELRALPELRASSGPVAWTWLLDLAGALPAPEAGPGVGVLFDRGHGGERATLRLSLLPGLTHTLVPDPGRMLLTSADGDFRRSLCNAWGVVGDQVDGTVLWSLETSDGPIASVGGPSLGAAFTVLLDEQRRLQSRLRRLVSVRRLNARALIVGGIDEAGHLVSVGGYAAKLQVVGDTDRVVVPASDGAAASDANEQTSELTPVAGWKDAARAARNWDRRSWLRFGALVVPVLVVLVMVAGYIAHANRQRAAEEERARATAELRQTAERLASTARSLAQGDVDGTGLLLAMASDDLAQQAGMPSHVFDSMAHDNTTLVAMPRLKSGKFNEAALASDGDTALLATSTGLAELIGTAEGSVRWSHQYGSGFTIGSDAVDITAVTFGPRDRAAFATSDRTLVVLDRQGSAWTDREVSLNLVSRRLNSTELNAPSLVALSPSGTRIAAYGAFGLIVIDLTKPTALVRCPALGGATAMKLSDDHTVLLARANEVLAERVPGCATARRISAPTGTKFTDVGIGQGGHPFAVGVKDATLLQVTDRGHAMVVSDRGPYQDPQITGTGDELLVSAATDSGTFGWQLTDRRQVFGFRQPGRVVASGRHVVLLAGGRIEVHDSAGSPFAAVARYNVPATRLWTGWVGRDLVVGRHPRRVDVIRDAAHPGHPFHDDVLPAAPGLTLKTLATDPGGSAAAAIYYQDDRATSHRQWKVIAWDVPHSRAVPVVLTSEAVPTAVGFHSGRLLIGFADGTLAAYRLERGAWRQVDSSMLGGNVHSLVGSDKAVFALVVKTGKSGPTAVKVAAVGLDLLASRDLPGPTGLGQITALPGGAAAVAYGTGQVVVFDEHLNVRWTAPNLGYYWVEGIYPVPQRSQMIVSGRLQTTTLDYHDETVLSDRTWFRAGTVSAAATSADGASFATYDYLAMRITVWSMDPRQVRRKACAVIGRDLTPAEWQRYVGDTVPYHPVCHS
jgi:hypothetical protein